MSGFVSKQFNKSLLVITSWLMLFSCYSYSPSNQRRVELTERHVEDYQLGPADLNGITVYLAKKLVLRREEITRNKSSSAKRGLNLETVISVDEVIFSANSRGTVVRVWQEETFWGLSSETKIKAVFKNRSNTSASLTLTFSPSWGGGYYLEGPSFWGGGILYGGRTYDCITGCSDNYLIIPTTERQKVQTRRSTGGRY